MARVQARVAGSSATAARRGLRAIVSPERLVLAGKAALAASIAWFVARLMPGFLDDYAYYAPFGAVVAMMPSVVDSLRTGLQTVLGLAVGGGIAYLAFVASLPVAVTVPLVILVAILVAGMLPPGPGRDYVSVAAIFVLMAGGPHPDMFGISYVVLTGTGLVIGAVVHLAILPPLRTLPLERRLEALEASIASLLDDLATSLEDAEQPVVSLEERAATLQLAVDDARDALRDAQRTRRANVRAMGGRYAISVSTRRLGDLRPRVRELMSLASVVSDERVTLEVPDAMDQGLRSTLAGALRELSRATTEHDGDDDLRRACDTARDALVAWEAPSAAAPAAAAALAHHLVALEQRMTGREPEAEER